MKKFLIQALLLCNAVQAVSDNSKEYVTQLSDDKFTASSFQNDAGLVFNPHKVGKLDPDCINCLFRAATIEETGKWLQIDLEKEEIVRGVFIEVLNSVELLGEEWTVWVSNDNTIGATMVNTDNKCNV